MDLPDRIAVDEHPPWGLREAALGWLASVLLSLIFGAAILSAAGYVGVDSDTWPLWLLAVLQVPLWVGLVGAPVWAVRGPNRSLRADFGLAFTWRDVPAGLALGVACQVLLVPAVSYPWMWLLGRDIEELGERAQQLADQATDPLGVILLVAIVAIGAPIVEELFYRGLVLRSLRQHVSKWWAIVVSGLIFGAVHFEPLQFPALAAFGVVLAIYATRTGRLGGPIFAHLAFNGFTVWYLVR